jgi:ferrous iron transport protein B
VVVALNLVDEAQRRGIVVDAEKLAAELRVPVITTVARDKQGLVELAAAVADVCAGKTAAPLRRQVFEAGLEAAVGELERLIEADVPGVPNARWIAIRLLEGDDSVRQALESGELARRSAAPPSAEGAGIPVEVTP